MSKTIPFGSYQEGRGLLPATKLAPTWDNLVGAEVGAESLVGATGFEPSDPSL
jgi:hypothetical protein